MPVSWSRASNNPRKSRRNPLAHWSSYPQYSYESLYRGALPNPRAAKFQPGDRIRYAASFVKGYPKKNQADISAIRGTVIRSELPNYQSLGFPFGTRLYFVEWYHLPGREAEAMEPTLAHAESVRANPSTAAARAVRWAMPENAGPYLPAIYPYGQQGIPYEYEFPSEVPVTTQTNPRRGKKNPRRRARPNLNEPTLPTSVKRSIVAESKPRLLETEVYFGGLVRNARDPWEKKWAQLRLTAIRAELRKRGKAKKNPSTGYVRALIRARRNGWT